MEQEKELLQNQNTWLNSELKCKTEELSRLSRQKGKEILELKCSLESKTNEVWEQLLVFWAGIYELNLSWITYMQCHIHQVTRLQDQVNTLKQNNDNLQKSTEDLMNKLKEVHCHQCHIHAWFTTWHCGEVKLNYFCITLFQAKDQRTSMEEKYRNELNANLRLCNLYKVCKYCMCWAYHADVCNN